ncbi:MULTISPECIES: pyruvoyl-dependent arginine decarboxylase [Salinibaculum]|uniref:pyruvoyl-dependent arginine decarboxylase n=1 Tax=Salinibaculum TaxID=2732368 RepID=UPI0030CBA072
MIRVVLGTGTAHTAKGSFDRALAAAGLHQYNLRELSSVIPAGADVEVVGTAPDLGPTGNVLDAVIARQTSPPGTRAAAGLAWARDDDGAGIFYEVGDHDPESVAELLRSGIQTGCDIRGIEGADVHTEVTTAAAKPDRYSTAVVVAAYGESEPLL